MLRRLSPLALLVACSPPADPPASLPAVDPAPVAVTSEARATDGSPSPPAAIAARGDEDAPTATPIVGFKNPLAAADQALRDQAILDLDEGRYDHALALLGPLLARYPSNPALRGLHEAARESLTVIAEASAMSLALRPATRVARPPFVYTLREAVSLADLGPMPRLRRLSERRNGITDDEEWFTRNDLRAPTLDVPNPFRGISGSLPLGIPAKYGDFILVRGVAYADHTVLIYGNHFGDGRFLAVLGADLEVRALFDFEEWLTPDAFVSGDRQFVDESIQWAQVDGGVLYLANGHRTYAASSKGHNAYLSALDLATGALLWRSQPLVQNAGTFVIHGPAILGGYGFTAEPDYLTVIDRRDGTTASKVPIKSGPDALIEKDGILHVRTYDHDYTFAID